MFVNRSRKQGAHKVSVSRQQAFSANLQLPRIQPKLQINEPGDVYEQEADRVAETVVQQMKEGPIQRMDMPEEEELQMKPEAGSIQRMDMPEEEELQMKPEAGSIQRMADLEQEIQSERGSGQSMDKQVKGQMEQAFGADFSQVRIHNDAKSDQLSRSIHAQAFTTGQDIFFQNGKYNPGSDEGKKLLAHELTHVVQQTGAQLKEE